MKPIQHAIAGCALIALTVAAGLTSADEPVASSTAGNRFALILCGHPGDSDHVEPFRATVEKIRAGLADHYQYSADNIHVLSGGDEPDDEDSTTPEDASRPATKENIVAEVALLKEKLTDTDSLLVVAIGHTFFDNNQAWFNLHGPDIQQKEFAELFRDVKAKEQVFLITIPCSGYYIRELSAPGRIVITATETDLEVNETLCPHVLGDMFSQAPVSKWDLDADKQLSVFEFYIALCRGVADRYTDETLIATEHGLLDDNGDGRGSELQQHYLTEEQGGLPKNRQRPTLVEGRDGMAASKVRLATFGE